MICWFFFLHPKAWSEEFTDSNYLLSNYQNLLNCDYLPLANNSIPCFYKLVTCDIPQNITNAFIVNKLENISEKFPLHAEVTYSCQDEQFEMKGNNTVTCLHSGHWSGSPQCLNNLQHESNVTPLVIVLPMLIMSLLLYLAIRVAFRCIQRKAYNLTRNKMFDAFVCYALDSENHFVINSVLPELEEKYNPPFKLCTHERNFDPG